MIVRAAQGHDREARCIVGKLIYSMNVSLDGFVETTNHSLDWANVDEELHRWFNDQARTLDASLYGRRMYEVMAGYWPTGEDDPAGTDVMREFSRIWKPMPKIVFSTTLDRVEHNAGRTSQANSCGETSSTSTS